MNSSWKDTQDESMSRGYWITPSEIQTRIKERQKRKSKEALVLFGVVIVGMAILLGLVFLLI